MTRAPPSWLSGEESACSAGDMGSIPRLGRSPAEGNGNPLQYSYLENPMDREAWRATVCGVTESRRLNNNRTHLASPTWLFLPAAPPPFSLFFTLPSCLPFFFRSFVARQQKPPCWCWHRWKLHAPPPPRSGGMLSPSLVTIPHGVKATGTHPGPPARCPHWGWTRPEDGGMALSPPSLALLFQTRECCAGYFGPQCQPCPGKAENVCFGNGICLDGANGTGACECGRGFSGTACETCAEGKYGIHCDQGVYPSGLPKPAGVQAERGSKHLLPNQPVSRAGWNPATSMWITGTSLLCHLHWEQRQTFRTN